jgi:hypothetical protein
VPFLRLCLGFGIVGLGRLGGMCRRGSRLFRLLPPCCIVGGRLSFGSIRHSCGITFFFFHLILLFNYYIGSGLLLGVFSIIYIEIWSVIVSEDT